MLISFDWKPLTTFDTILTSRAWISSCRLKSIIETSLRRAKENKLIINTFFSEFWPIFSCALNLITCWPPPQSSALSKFAIKLLIIDLVSFHTAWSCSCRAVSINEQVVTLFVEQAASHTNLRNRRPCLHGRRRWWRQPACELVRPARKKCLEFAKELLTIDLLSFYNLLGIGMEHLFFKYIELSTRNSTKRSLTVSFGWVSDVQLVLR